MNIHGENIVLRAIEIKDGEMLMEIINDPDTEYGLGGWSLPVSTTVQEEWIAGLRKEKDSIKLVIEDKDSGEAVGVIMLTDIDNKNGNAQIHIKLSTKNVRGKGYGTSAINALTKYAFDELRLHLVYSFVQSNNTASQKLFSKCGYTQEGIMRSRLYKRGEHLDVIPFSIINKRD